MVAHILTGYQLNSTILRRELYNKDIEIIKNDFFQLAEQILQATQLISN